MLQPGRAQILEKEQLFGQDDTVVEYKNIAKNVEQFS